MISYLSNNLYQFAEWLAFDHPEHWAKVLPSCLAPKRPLPFVPYKGHEEEYAALPEEASKIQGVAEKEALERYNQEMAQYNPHRNWLRGSPRLENPRIRGISSTILPGKIIKGSPCSWETYQRKLTPLDGPISIVWDASRSEGYGRAVMAKRMRLTIEALHLNHLYVPDKKITSLSGGYTVAVIEKLDIMASGDYSPA